MFKSNKKKQKTIIYRLMINNKSTKVKITRIKSIKDHFDNLIKTEEFFEGKGFFKYESEGISTHFFPESVDIIFVNRDSSITEIIKDLKPNKITKRYNRTKFVYILPRNTIKSQNINIDDTISHQKWKRKI